MHRPHHTDFSALLLTQYGPLHEGLSIGARPTLTPGKTQVLIRTEAAGLNPHDVKLARGDLQKHEPLNLPSGLGGDIAGVIVQVGAQVSQFAPGDRVFGIAYDAIAEHALANETDIAKLPTGLGFESSAGLPVAGLTVLQAFERAGGILPGTRVLIHAGTGGVGSLAIQYAKSMGAEVYTTVSTRNIQMARDLGADHVIDYRASDYRKYCQDLDMVFDTLGGEATFEAFEVLRPGGHIVSIVPSEINGNVARELHLPLPARVILNLRPSRIDQLCKTHDVSYDFVFMRPNATNLKTLRNLVESRALRPICDKVFPFAKTIEAMEYLAKGHARGKVIVSFREGREDQLRSRQSRHPLQSPDR